MRERGGFTLVEALVVLVLILLVLQGAWTITASMGRAAAALADGAESLAASRATAWILQGELDGVRAPGDVTAPAGDSISVRAFRGAAVVCPAAASGLSVRWSGMRAPDPTKDSVLVLDAGGGWSVSRLAGRVAAPGACSPGQEGLEERWTIEPPAPNARLLRLFERGTYALADDAFRYRIGAGGRQPLTPATVDPAGSGLAAAGADGIALALVTRGVHRNRAAAEVRRVFRVSGRWGP